MLSETTSEPMLGTRRVKDCKSHNALHINKLDSCTNKRRFKIFQTYECYINVSISVHFIYIYILGGDGYE